MVAVQVSESSSAAGLADPDGEQVGSSVRRPSVPSLTSSRTQSRASSRTTSPSTVNTGATAAIGASVIETAGRDPLREPAGPALRLQGALLGAVTGFGARDRIRCRRTLAHRNLGVQLTHLNAHRFSLTARVSPARCPSVSAPRP